MRIYLYIGVLAILLFGQCQPVFAQTTERERLVAELHALLVQLVALQEELYAKQSRGEVLGEQTTRLQPSRFYSGTYEAIYLIDGVSLVPYGPTIADPSDQQLWELWRRVVGDSTIVRYFTEFRIYNDPHAEYDAFVEQQGETNDWIFGVNVATVGVHDVYSHTVATELFVHEYAHVLHHYEYEVAQEFTDIFWTPPSRSSSDYVSDYAMIDAEEDFAESFMYFVLRGTPPRGEAREKVAFFTQFDSFEEIRASMRTRLTQ